MTPVATSFPIDKVLYSTLAGAAVAIVAYVIKQSFGLELPAEIVSSLTVLVTFVTAYFVPLKRAEISELNKDVK